MIPQKVHKSLIFRAFKRLKVWEDAEDAVQSAYLLLLKYKDRLDVSNPERTMTWLVDQEVIRIWKKLNGVTSTGKVHGKIFKFDDISRLDMDAEDEIVSRASYVSYNEGDVRYDVAILAKRKDELYLKSEYLGNKFAEKVFTMTECYSRTKYGTYVRIKLTDGYPKKYREIRCYKQKA
jgi:hypothetical protein